MVDNAWNHVGESGLGGTTAAQMFINPYPNIKALLQKIPYQKNSISGNKLESALKGNANFGLDPKFSSDFNKMLGQKGMIDKIANLTPKERDENIGKVLKDLPHASRIIDGIERKAAVPSSSAPAPTPTPSARQASPEPIATVAAVAAGIVTPSQKETAIPAPQQTEQAQAPAQAQAQVSIDPQQVKLKTLMGSIAKAPGFVGFMNRVNGNDDLKKAFGSMTGDDVPMDKKIKMAESIQEGLKKKPDMFEKVNEFIDKSPQNASFMAREFTANPDAAFDHIGTEMGRQKIKTELESKFGDTFDGLMDGPLGNMLGDAGGIWDSLKNSAFGEMFSVVLGYLGELGSIFAASIKKMKGYVKEISDPQSPRINIAKNGDAHLAQQLQKDQTQQPKEKIINGSTGKTVVAEQKNAPDQTSKPDDPKNKETQDVNGPNTPALNMK